MGAIQNAINRTLVLGGAATAARKKDLQNELEEEKLLAQSSQDNLNIASKLYNNLFKKPENSNVHDIIHESGTKIINAMGNSKTQGILGIKERINNLKSFRNEIGEATEMYK